MLILGSLMPEAIFTPVFSSTMSITEKDTQDLKDSACHPEEKIRDYLKSSVRVDL